MNKKWNEMKWYSKFLYSFLVGIAFIGIWRGCWGLLDMYLFPNIPILSYFLTLVFGVMVLLITHNKLS